MTKIILLISILIVTACTNQTLNISTAPSYQPMVTIIPSSVTAMPTTQPTALPSPVITATPLPYTFPDTKETFIIDAFIPKDKPFPNSGYEVSMSLDEIGNGVIVSNNLVKVNNFRIENELHDFTQGTYGASTSVSVNSKGTGLIIWGEGGYGCTDYCPPTTGHIWGRKLENYLPSGDYFVIDEDLTLNTAKPYLKIDESGNGKIIYFGSGFVYGNGKAYYKDVQNFQVQGERKEFTDEVKTLSEDLKTSINNQGKGAMVYHLDQIEPVDESSQSIFLKKIIDNKVSDAPVKISINRWSIKGEPVIDLNQNGDGLVLWSDSFSGECLYCHGFLIHARYINNFNPQ
jgi:hypothetical protein